MAVLLLVFVLAQFDRQTGDRSDIWFDVMIDVPITLALLLILFSSEKLYLYVWFVPPLADLLYHFLEPLWEIVMLRGKGP